MSKVSFSVFPNSIVVSFNGKVVTLNKEDQRYNNVLQAIKDQKLDTIPDLLDVSKIFGLKVKDGLVYIDNEPLHGVLNDRIVKFQKEGIPYDSLIKFARKLRANPSYNSREQLYKFLEHNGHPITSEGNFLAYRGVSDDFKDKHTGQFDNSPGSVCEMPRDQVDDNPNNTCSRGLHVACYDYAKDFARQLVEVEVDPRDVVCVPMDYNGTKMRVCKFKVVQVCQKLNEAVVVNSSYEESDEFVAPEVSDEETCDGDCFDSCAEHSQDEEENWEELTLKVSECVKSAEWNSETEELRVTLHDGSIYLYQNVPSKVTYEWEEYHSTGSFYVNYIAHSYNWTKEN